MPSPRPGPLTFLAGTDDPAALLPNGHVLVTLSPQGPLTPGAATGAYANYGSDNDGVTVWACDIFGNTESGIIFGSDNDNWTIAGNRVHDNNGFGSYGISINGNFLNAVVRDNAVFNNTRYGIYPSGNISTSTVTGNAVYGNPTGTHRHHRADIGELRRRARPGQSGLHQRS